MTDFLEQLKNLIKEFESKNDVQIEMIMIRRQFETPSELGKNSDAKINLTLELY